DKKEYIAIDKAEEKEYYKVSSAEKRLFAVWEMDKTSIVYNIPMILEINEGLDKEKIEKSLSELVRRHEALRTSFKVLDGDVVQKVEKEWKLDYIYKELESSEVKEKTNNFIRPFDLTKAPLMRAELIKCEAQKYIFMIDFHHIIVDGVSTSILMDEFVKLYQGEKLSEPILQYKDYAEWQNTLEEKGIIKEQEEYWMNRFKGEIPVLNIQTDYERPNVQSYEGDRINFTLDKATADKLNNIAKETGATLYTVLLSAYNILLSKYSGQEDIIVGTVQAGRPQTELENVVGMFVNTVALRNYPKGDKTFKEFLEEVKNNTLRDFENTEYQFESFLDRLNLTREASRNPLFDTMFVLENIDFNVSEDNGKIKSIEPKLNMAKFDLTLTAMEIKEGISFSLEYCSKLFGSNTIKKMWEHFVNILEEIVLNPKIKLHEINMLSKEEENKLIREFNNTRTEYPRWSTIQELFEEQVEKSPNNIAVTFNGKELTYKELNEKSNSLARLLREKGVSSEKIVGIMVERSLDMIVGIMGILKAGGAYLPIDPEYPEERISYMLEDSSAQILLTKKSLLKDINFEGEIID
ncbi:non-ribosomal peptide synthetase, partial [Clostridium puniceum]|uniref:non-ribosomal peptide synthetase n=1 Tax=Clostridium puniceum TaxID=29367 RepID=UPI001177E2CD